MGAWSSGQWRDRARLGERCNQERTSEFIRMGENGGKTDVAVATSGMTTSEGTAAGRTNSDCTHTGVIRHPSKLPTAEAELGQTSGAVVGGRDIRDGTDVGDKRGDAWGRGMKDRVDGICGGFSAGRLRETN